MADIIGAFVFEDDGNGCLTGKWLNNDEPTPYPEASKLLKDKAGKHPFEGTYKTTWIEQGQNVEHSDLIISLRTTDVYDVEWRRGRNIVFHGRGMIYKGMLIGSYWI